MSNGIAKYEMAGQPFKEFMGTMMHEYIQETIRESERKINWYRNQYLCSIEEFAMKSKSLRAMEEAYFDEHKVLFDYMPFPYYMENILTPREKGFLYLYNNRGED